MAMAFAGIAMVHQRLCELRVLENDNYRSGYFAIADIKAGKEILCELPFVACPSVLSPGAVNKFCDYCLSGLESPMEYITPICPDSVFYKSFLTRVVTEVPPEKHDVVWCEAGCNTAYCSVECREAAWSHYHAKICPGTDARKVDKLEELRNL